MKQRPGIVTALVPALLAAGATWLATWSWRGFTTDPWQHLWPLAVLAVLVALVGGLGRASGLASPVVLLGQVVLGAVAVSYLLTGAWLPVGAGWDTLDETVRQAVSAAQAYGPPVPAEAGLDPLLVLSGWWCLLLVDAVAGGLGRPAVAALPLLVVFAVPVSILGSQPEWWVFAGVAVAWTGLLFLDASSDVARWGGVLDDGDGRVAAASVDEPAAEPGTTTVHGPRASDALGVRSAGVRATALGVGTGAVVLALAVPASLPALDVHLLDYGPGAGGDDGISIENPMTDLRRDLRRRDDVPLLDVRTDDPDPSYLRVAVLNRFGANEWTSGDRSIPTDQVADGQPLDVAGVGATVDRTTYRYQLEARDAFSSRWLPTYAPATSVSATGDWRFDTATGDFIAADEDLTTAGLTWSTSGVELDLEQQRLESAVAVPGAVDPIFTELPDNVPGMVGDLAREVTQGQTRPFGQAVALQDWFRQNFDYSLENVPPGNGVDELVAFLSPGEGGRVGYCEQFASAMAVMARELGIPSRVAVGFLSPEQQRDGTWEYSAYDMHAWPELYLPYAGWVRFEPTPPTRASGVPSYAEPTAPDAQPTASAGASDTPSQQASARPDRPTSEPTVAPRPEAATPTADEEPGVGLAPVLGGLLGLVALVGLASAPAWLRARRRHRRLRGGPEDWWDELADGTRDLGLPWPDGASPRSVGALLGSRLADPDDDRERPVLGPEQNPEAAAALGRLVSRMERSRYARGGSGDGSGTEGSADVAVVVDGLAAGVRRRARWAARWTPRSLLRRSGSTPAADRGPLDRVG
ncbi:transglutaminase family protein [Nocardioides bruguierae]|uniref:TransglutaminaseTgpA domain-containing protein n=1 Tax=Nocardioides bruguierae TaxID=2945102 RepID=A0A9X2D984_9ACTN|nr:DUF3488 and transglutaminase-like domain-containing protein [Nocardioides bruguierae]MCM0621627.1 transglutaminaseTgpA domain-containing protein [Nocardioides bruguierae]